MNTHNITTPKLIKDLGYKYTSKTNKYKRQFGLYECPICMKHWEVMTESIKTGNTTKCKSCSSKIGRNKSHGKSSHRIYGTWKSMKNRCLNKNSYDYLNYGGRGIQICDRWLNIDNFIEDMDSTYFAGSTIDRIDVNGNYEPSNCRWATHTLQAQNTRKLNSTNTSGYRGVTWHKLDKNWQVVITCNKKKIYLGRFKNPIDGAKARDIYIIQNNLEHTLNDVLTQEEIKAIKCNQNYTA